MVKGERGEQVDRTIADSGLKSRDRGYLRHKGSLIKLLNIHGCDFGRSCDACKCVRAHVCMCARVQSVREKRHQGI